MATHRDGFVWVLTAIDRSGRRKKLAERPTRLELRFLRRWWMAWLKKHPREFHSLREHYLTVGEASLFDWAERKPSSTQSGGSSRAATIQPGATAGWLVALYKSIEAAGWTAAARLRITLHRLTTGKRRNVSH